ncbi:tetratricopeptide repeat domain protein [Coleofasciculus chthonoplastes PCC 7420]|uniref:Tetratricopeptide repeat domain protein n=1 Tax=Coleofasciculus chthonoplastes PCC 7420 TaxID=118168 RepID=B4VKA5_9CYAN|nr:CHAT domain-containing protein [Coleofasciculus chthonoplastes]EDX77661.1 tetratricopeptide repeat domain protein [Coleofasciculus chthonoplastes PCC 7420]
MKWASQIFRLKIRSSLRWYASSVILFGLTLFLVTTVLPGISYPVESLHVSGDKVEDRGQRAEGHIAQTDKILHLGDNTRRLKRQSPNAKIANSPTPLEQGIAAFEAGRFADAAQLWQQAAQEYEAKSDRLNQALSLSYLSLAYQNLGQVQDAEQAISQSLDLLQHQDNWESGGLAILGQALNTQGRLQLTKGQAEAALDTWKQASDAYRRAGDETGKLGSQINQAQALQTLGLYRRAQTRLEQANQHLQAQPDSLLKVQGLQSLGIALQELGDPKTSQTLLTQSLAIAQKLNPTPDTSAILLSLGNVARDLQEDDKALDYYQKAAKNATDSLIQIKAQLNQLSLLINTEQEDAAIALLPQIQVSLATLSPSRAAVYAHVNLADSLMRMSSDVETCHGTSGCQLMGLTDNLTPETGSAKALTTNGAKALTTNGAIAQILAKAIQQARQIQDAKAESYALGELGKLYEQKQQLAEAQKLTQQALSLVQVINAGDIAYLWEWQLGRILEKQGNIKDAVAAYTVAVETLRSLRSDLIALPNLQFYFRERVEPVYRQLVGLLLKSDPSQKNLQKAREVIESLQLAELDNFFRNTCIQAQSQQIDQVDPTAAVIYPIILPDRLAVILSLPGQPLHHYQTQLPEAEVNNAFVQLRKFLNPVLSNKQRLRYSQDIYDWLIRPIEAELADNEIKTLVFILDGALRNLPMAALYDGEQYLIEKYSVAVSPGLQLLEPRALDRERLQALIGGLSEERGGFSALPGVELELKKISDQVPSEMLFNQEFTTTTLKQEISDVPFPIVHLATHGQFSSEVEDTFILTWEGPVNVNDLDQLLQVREREDNQPIELLVLSACQTATGDQRAALGLAGVAVRSGARSTLATLWSVRDESTAQLMAEFYQYLTQAENSKAESLRQAQLSILKNPKYEHPYYWAPFVLVGNWL